MSVAAASFSATGVGPAISAVPRDVLSYAVSGTFVGTWAIQKSLDGGQSWIAVVTGAATATSTHNVDTKGRAAAIYRFACTAYTSGTVVTTMTEVATPSAFLVDPTTTKGDTLARGASGVNALTIGTDGQVLTADAASTNGVKWAAPVLANVPLIAKFRWDFSINGGTGVMDLGTLPIGSIVARVDSVCVGVPTITTAKLGNATLDNKYVATLTTASLGTIGNTQGVGLVSKSQNLTSNDQIVRFTPTGGDFSAGIIDFYITYFMPQ